MKLTLITRLTIVTTVTTLVMLFSNSVNAKATTYGIGSSLSNTSILSFPINSQNYLFEPNFNFSSNNRKYNGNIADENRQDFTIDLGIYKKSKVSKKGLLYYGIVFGISQENTSRSIDKYGFVLTPTFGTEYYLVPDLSLGIEFGFYFLSLKVKDNQANLTNLGGQETQTGTQSRIILRFHF